MLSAGQLPITNTWKSIISNLPPLCLWLQAGALQKRLKATKRFFMEDLGLAGIKTFRFCGTNYKRVEALFFWFNFLQKHTLAHFIKGSELLFKWKKSSNCPAYTLEAHLPNLYVASKVVLLNIVTDYLSFLTHFLFLLLLIQSAFLSAGLPASNEFAEGPKYCWFIIPENVLLKRWAKWTYKSSQHSSEIVSNAKE